MNDIIQFLFSVNNREPLDILLQTLALAAIAVIVIWLAQLVWFRTLRNSHPGEPVDVLYNLALLRSLVSYMILLAVFFFFMIKINGLHAFRWSEPAFYLAMLPLLIVFLIPLLVYLIRYSRLMNLIK
ncbi:hypothetical protein AB9P05_00280 [Roseivirga sp. BDSF3-8]|uniref:hypothetical protein n=1 Tax=Roseivirga sp. BDSF3-8 TaxID=3241598 RepID=UPI003531EE64